MTFKLPLAHHTDAVAHLSGDPVMREVIAQVGELAVLLPTPDPLGTLVRSVTGQQLSVKAAERIHARLVNLLGEVTPETLLEIDDEDLRGVGLSWAKVRTVKAIADAAATGRIDFDHLSQLADEEIIAELTPLPGIGRWTVEMYLIFALARPDVFSIGDLALRQGVARLHPNLQAFETLALWEPYKTLAARYIWADNARVKAGGAPI